MAEDTAAYTLKPGPKAELDGLRAAREEFGPIPPRPGTRPVRVGSARAPPHLPLTCSPCDAAEMKVTREEMKNARLPLECAQIPLMRTTHASPHARTPPPAASLPRRAVPCAPPLHRAKGAGSLPPSLGAAACHGPRATGAAAPTHRQPARTSRHTHPSDHMACAVARTPGFHCTLRVCMRMCTCTCTCTNRLLASHRL